MEFTADEIDVLFDALQLLAAERSVERREQTPGDDRSVLIVPAPAEATRPIIDLARKIAAGTVPA